MMLGKLDRHMQSNETAWVIFHCVNHILFIHLSVDEHLGSFHALAIVNSAAMNTEVSLSHYKGWNNGIFSDMEVSIMILSEVS